MSGILVVTLPIYFDGSLREHLVKFLVGKFV